MASTPVKFTYAAYILPKCGDVFEDCVRRYAAFRLKLLSDINRELTGSDEIESKFSHDEWHAFLGQAHRNVVVCVQLSTDLVGLSQDQALIEGKWVGVSLLLGPILLQHWKWPNSGLRTDAEETRWHSGGTYVEKEHRGERLLELMVSTLHQFCRRETQRLLGEAASDDGLRTYLNHRWRFGVDGTNLSVVKFYESMFGARATGIVTRSEMFKAMGFGYKETEQQQPDSDSPEYGVAMELEKTYPNQALASISRGVNIAKL